MSAPDSDRLDRSVRRKRAVSVTGLQAGIVMAVAAVAAGAFFTVRPPDAYGICMACHGRDLVGWISNMQLGTDIAVAPASLVFPLLTSVGVLIGAGFAAMVSGEFRWRRRGSAFRSFLAGVAVMNFALIAAGCSIRLALRTSALDPLGIAGFGAFIVGVVLATYWLRWRASR